MSGSTDAGTRRRWTLGGSMIAIAVLAVLLAIYARHAREVAWRDAAGQRLRESLREAIVCIEDERVTLTPAVAPGRHELRANLEGNPR